MYSYNLDLSNNSYALEAIKKTGANGVSLFLYDNRLNKNPISFIYHKHLSTGIIRDYQNGLHRFDPFIPRSTSIYHDCKKFTVIRCNPKKKLYPSPCHRIDISSSLYWDYFTKLGFKDLATCFKSISNNLFLVVGLNKNDGNILCLDSGISCIEDWLKEVGDYIIEESVRNFFNEVKLEPNISNNTDELLKPLSNRQSQLVYELLKGKSNKQIANSLTLSNYTIENYLKTIYRKLNVKNRTSLIALFNSFHKN